MKFRNRLISIFVFLLLLAGFKIQGNDSIRKVIKRDSLLLALKNAPHDSVRAKVLVELVEIAYQDDPAMALTYAKKAYYHALHAGYKRGLAYSSGWLAYLYDDLGDISKASGYYHKSLQFHKEAKNKKGIATALNNLGTLYDNQGDVVNALDYYHQCLKLREELNDKTGMSTILNNIGFLYQYQGDTAKALDYYQRSYKIDEEVGNKDGMATSLVNMGALYSRKGDQEKAFDALNKSLKLYEELDYRSGIAYSLVNIGTVYRKIGDHQKALEYFNKSLSIREDIKDKWGLAYSTGNIAKTYFDLNDIDKSYAYATRSLDLAREVGFPKGIMEAAGILQKIYRKKKNFKEALLMYELEIQMRDSVSNQETKKAAVQRQYQYEYEKKEAVINAEHKAELNKQQVIASEKHRKQQYIIGSVIVCLLLLGAFAGFVVRSLKITNRQKQMIELQKARVEEKNILVELQKREIEEKHKEITDSINYAERIQRSFLATQQLLDGNLNEYFVFFQPKDVVSGDFYWASKLDNGNFILATADSTGHGVPGAIMSILNISALEKAIEKGLQEPAEIFDHARRTIIERLKKDGSEEGGKDGMDCSLVSFDFKNGQLTYAAAHNPVWIVRGQQILELDYDKMPVGKHDKDSIPFTQHTVDLQKGDVVYTLTDGISDQFGGPKGKKFMHKRLKELLLGIAGMPMSHQRERLAASLNAWKGNLEQIDDMCLIGVRI